MKRYGWLPDVPDRRDITYRSVRSIPKVLPPAVDLRPKCPPVEDQGELGSCTAHALTGALEFLEGKDSLPMVQFSRLFVYYNERVLEHSVSSDNGAQLRDGIKTLAKQGVCAESLWPYDIAKFKRKPLIACYRQAAAHEITGYQRIDMLDEMRACLADGFPFVFGFTVYESFESEEVAKTGVVDLPGAGEKVLGGHAVLAVGYDDGAERFVIRNSWGTAWGMGGYFTMPYDYCTNRDLSDDFWVVRRGENM